MVTFHRLHCNIAFTHFCLNVFTTGAEKQDYFEQIPIIIRELVYRLNDENAAVLVATNKAFSSLSKFVPAQELVKHVEFMRNILGSMVSESRRRKGGVGDGEFLLPGFNIPKGKNSLIILKHFERFRYSTPNDHFISLQKVSSL
jgi:hypothetical protein